MRWVVVALMLAVPSAAGGATTLYAHLSNPDDFILQLEPPPASYHADLQWAVGATLACAPDAPGQTFTQRDQHVWYGYVGMAPIVYHDGEAPFHTDRGIQSDLRLDPEAPATFHWYLSTHAAQDIAVGPPVPIVVDVTIREGDEISVGRTAFNTGKVVATGSSHPVWTGPTAPGTREVHHFEVPLTLHETFVSRNESFNVRVDARLDNAFCTDEKLVPAYAVHTSAEHRPRLEWTTVDPVRIMGMAAERVGDHLALHAAMEATFGEQQLVDTSASLTGPEGEVPLEAVSLRSDGHRPGYGGHGPPRPFVFLWVARAPPPGDYTWTLTAAGLGTDPLVQSQVVSLPADAEAPFPPLVAVATLLLASAWRRQPRS